MADGDFQIPAGYPRARLPSLHSRLREAVDVIQAVGGTVAAVEISPEGGVRVLTTAGAPPVGIEPANEWDELVKR